MINNIRSEEEINTRQAQTTKINKESTRFTMEYHFFDNLADADSYGNPMKDV